MNCCRHCGVELEPDALSCPLCQQPLHAATEGDQRALPATPSATAPPAPPEAKRRLNCWLLEIFSLLAVTTVFVVLAADLANGMSLTWSRYPLASLAYLWLAMFLLILGAGRLWVLLPAQILAASLFLFILDGFTPGPTWFLPLALPMALLAGVILAPVLAITSAGHLSLFTIMAIALLSAGVYVVGVELLLNRFLAGRWFVSWSAVPFACALPVSLILLYLRKRLRSRQAEIRKMLHL